MLIMLENNDTRYEFYMQGIKRSNIDDTIVRWELRYDVKHNLTLGSTLSYNNRLLGHTFEEFVEKLLLEGFEVVTFSTRKFA